MGALSPAAQKSPASAITLKSATPSRLTRDLKTALLCISFLRKGEVLAYVGRIHNLKDLKVGQIMSLSAKRLYELIEDLTSLEVRAQQRESPSLITY